MPLVAGSPGTTWPTWVIRGGGCLPFPGCPCPAAEVLRQACVASLPWLILVDARGCGSWPGQVFSAVKTGHRGPSAKSFEAESPEGIAAKPHINALG